MISSCALTNQNNMNEEQRTKFLKLLEYCDFVRLDKNIAKVARVNKNTAPYDVIRINNYTNKQPWATTVMHDKISEVELQQWIENATINISGNDIRIETVYDNVSLNKLKTNYGFVFKVVKTNKNGKAMQMISSPIDEMAGVRIRLTSHLKNKKGDDIPLSEWVNLHANKIDTLENKDSRYHRFEIKIDRENEDKLMGYIELRLLKSLNYNRVNIELKNKNLHKEFMLDNIPFELIDFEPGNFFVAYNTEYQKTVDDWEYFVVTDNQYINASSSRKRSDYYDNLIQYYKNPDMTIGGIITMGTTDKFKFSDIGLTKNMLYKEKDLKLTKSDIESLFAIDETPRTEIDTLRMAICYLTNIEKAESVIIYNENSQRDDPTNSIGLFVGYTDNKVEHVIFNREK